MNRTIGGIPILYWALGLGVGALGFMWVKKRSTGAASPATAGRTAQPAFSQTQEVQDFQIFSALTSAQQGSDLNFLSEVAGLFAGGSSTGTSGGGSVSGGGGGGSTAPAPPSTGTAPPTTTPASNPATPAAPAPKAPGYGLVQTADGQMVWLGVNNAGSPVYNVGGGAPVYFGNAQGLATGAQYEQPGQDIYTPASYAGQVAGSPVNLQSAYT